jgi:predicted enzyme related to lactoylglutathione lyase
MARVTGIGGVFLKAKDPAALKQWYVEHLGMRLEDWGGVVFRWDDDAANQSAAGATVWHLADADGDWFEPSQSQVMINYRVDDLHGLLAQLADAGVACIKGPDESFNGLFAWVMDPEGNKVELWEPRDPA